MKIRTMLDNDEPWSTTMELGMDGRMHIYWLVERMDGGSDKIEVSVSLWQHPFTQNGKVPMNLAFM